MKQENEQNKNDVKLIKQFADEKQQLKKVLLKDESNTKSVEKYQMEMNTNLIEFMFAYRDNKSYY